MAAIVPHLAAIAFVLASGLYALTAPQVKL
jgi:hypothetical protein